MKNFKCTLLETGIHIQGDAENIMGGTYPVSLLLSLEEADLPWDKAMEWAKERGGELPSRAQWQAIQPHRDEINKLLGEAGKEKLGGWCWTREEYLADTSCAWAVPMGSGSVGWPYKAYDFYVRAVSAFPADLK